MPGMVLLLTICFIIALIRGKVKPFPLYLIYRIGGWQQRLSAPWLWFADAKSDQTQAFQDRPARNARRGVKKGRKKEKK